jgi:hypothetical protein
MATTFPDDKIDHLVDYLNPALDDLRGLDLEFESYLLEMVILSLREGGVILPRTTPLNGVPA